MLRVLCALVFSVLGIWAQEGVVATSVAQGSSVQAPSDQSQAALGPVIYSVLNSKNAPARVLWRDGAGSEFELGSYPGAKIGAIAVSSDRSLVAVLSYQQVVGQNQKSVKVGAAFGGAIGAMIGASISKGQSPELVGHKFHGLTVWDRRTGKTELIWDADGLSAIFRLDLLDCIRAFPEQTQLFYLSGTTFLLHSGGMLVKLDVQARKAWRVWVPKVPINEPGMVWQSPQGHLRFFLNDAIVGIEPNGEITCIEYLWPQRRLSFLGLNEFLATDGKVIRRARLNGNRIEEVGSFKLKNDLLLPMADATYLLAYRYTSFGGAQLTKVDIAGKNLWTTNLGPCTAGIVVGESDEKLWVLVRHVQPEIPWRHTLDATTGRPLGSEIWNGSEDLGSYRRTRAPYDFKFNEMGGLRTTVQPRLVWIPSDVTYNPPTPVETWRTWTPDPNKLGNQVGVGSGSWVKIYPDLTVEPLVTRALGYTLLQVGGHPILHAPGVAFLEEKPLPFLGSSMSHSVH